MTKKIIPSSPKSIKICSVQDCLKPQIAKTFCTKHYQRVKKTGSLNIVENRQECSVENCNSEYYAKTFCEKHYARWRKYGNALIIFGREIIGDSYVEIFFSRIEIQESGCWEWQGYRDKDGYGNARMNGKTQRAHRVAWFLRFGNFPKLDLLHSCDNPPCVNPDHLREGTAKENAADTLLRGRKPNLEGENNSAAKLNAKDVKEIRKLLKEGKTEQSISLEYGVTRSTISQIKLGKIWSHID